MKVLVNLLKTFPPDTLKWTVPAGDPLLGANPGNTGIPAGAGFDFRQEKVFPGQSFWLIGRFHS